MKKTVKSKKELLKWFNKHGWIKYGKCFENASKDSQLFAYDMFELCGTELDVDVYDNHGYDFTNGEWFWKKGWFNKYPIVKTVKSEGKLLKFFEDNNWTEDMDEGYDSPDGKHYFAQGMFAYCGTPLKVKINKGDDKVFTSKLGRWDWIQEYFVD